MLLKEKMKFKIVPQNIDDTFETEILSINNNCISFSLLNNALKKGEKFDAYMLSNDGIVFFSANADEIEDNIVKICTKITPELLQRRQYVRIKVDKAVKIKFINENEKFIDAHLLDISVGGFKLISKDAIKENETYFLNVNLNNNELILKFIPINIVENDDKTYTISARFENIQNTDKIALVQYCYKKQAEDIEE